MTAITPLKEASHETPGARLRALQVNLRAQADEALYDLMARLEEVEIEAAELETIDLYADSLRSSLQRVASAINMERATIKRIMKLTEQPDLANPKGPQVEAA